MFAPLGFVHGLTPEQIAAIADPRAARQTGLPTPRDDVKGGAWFCGPPELDQGDSSSALQEQLPRPRDGQRRPAGGHAQRVILEQLAWFARDVMPAFAGRPHGAGLG